MKTTGFVILTCGLLFGVHANAQNPHKTSDQEQVALANDLRQSTAPDVGDDMCMKWNLSEADLETCRHQWMQAKTETDRLAVRDRFGANTDISRDGHERQKLAAQSKTASAAK